MNDGIYFALPTQVTSNRIHERVAPFLRAALEDSATLRLAHGASWLEDCQTLRLHPAAPGDPDASEHVREGRSWFASAKHALLARFGVGTVDQALQGVVAVKHFFVRRFGLAGKVVILDEVHSYDVYTGTLITRLIRELLALRCSVVVLSATLTRARRAELIAAADADPGSARSEAYPLLTVARACGVRHRLSVPRVRRRFGSARRAAGERWGDRLAGRRPYRPRPAPAAPVLTRFGGGAKDWRSRAALPRAELSTRPRALPPALGRVYPTGRRAGRPPPSLRPKRTPGAHRATLPGSKTLFAEAPRWLSGLRPMCS
ncbi:MAG: hypothetical protein ACR2OZ_03700 [Verrucomicrobiales bacterium]